MSIVLTKRQGDPILNLLAGCCSATLAKAKVSLRLCSLWSIAVVVIEVLSHRGGTSKNGVCSVNDLRH